MYVVNHDGRHKSRLVIEGHVTDAEGYNTFASTILLEHVRLQVFLTAFFGDDILIGDIGSAYLNAKTKEKIYTKLGVEFGTKAGLTATVQKTLYGLKSSVNTFYMQLCYTLKKLGFKKSLLDPALWYRLREDKKHMTILAITLMTSWYQETRQLNGLKN